MQLIVDSGSTKIRWCLVNQLDIVQEIITQGINPYVTSEEVILNIVNDQVLSKLKFIPDSIFYYGAGCSTDHNNLLVKNKLKLINNSANIEVEHDLLAVARALCQKSSGIAVILGTGSNSCLYDGQSIIKNTPSLGFIVGDEGSGAYIGKKIIADLYYNRMPQHLAENLISTHNLSIENVLNKIYKEPAANAYLASFCKWLKIFIDEPYTQNLIYNAFSEFIDKQIKPYGNNFTNKVYSIGSIAHHFSDIWHKVLSEHSYIAEQSEQDPIKGLIKFHYNGKTN